LLYSVAASVGNDGSPAESEKRGAYDAKRDGRRYDMRRRRELARFSESE